MPTKPTIEFTAISADELSDIDEATVLVLQIPRDQIERQNISTTLEKLLVLTDNRQQALLRKESLMISVSGYDSDKREIFEIPEVRAFFKRLTAEWPYWLWFLARGARQIGLLMALICDIKIHRKGRQVGTAIDEKQMTQALGDMLERSIPMFINFDISPDVANASADTAFAELG